MHTMHERYEKTVSFINDPDVTVREGLVHAYLWTRFEWAIIQRNKHARRARRLAKRLNNNLEVVGFRKQMKDL